MNEMLYSRRFERNRGEGVEGFWKVLTKNNFAVNISALIFAVRF